MECSLQKREEEPWRVLEFYSGIGGMRYSLMKAGVNATLVEAFDINDTANDVYEHNFGHRPFQSGTICGNDRVPIKTHNELFKGVKKQLCLRQESTKEMVQEMNCKIDWMIAMITHLVGGKSENQYKWIMMFEQNAEPNNKGKAECQKQFEELKFQQSDEDFPNWMASYLYPCGYFLSRSMGYAISSIFANLSLPLVMPKKSREGNKKNDEFNR